MTSASQETETRPPRSSVPSTTASAQRAWRDAHFAASHIALNRGGSFAHWARTELAVERPREQMF